MLVSKRKYNDLKAISDTWQCRYETLKYELDVILNQMRKQNDQLKRRAESPISFSIDMDLLKPFSIERKLGEHNEYITIMGWYDSKGEIQEWNFHCDQETHETLVRQFNEVSIRAKV